VPIADARVKLETSEAALSAEVSRRRRIFMSLPDDVRRGRHGAVRSQVNRTARKVNPIRGTDLDLGGTFAPAVTDS
jgi:hypothetical protein